MTPGLLDRSVSEMVTSKRYLGRRAISVASHKAHLRILLGFGESHERK
jgi:hypothetical protein